MDLAAYYDLESACTNTIKLHVLLHFETVEMLTTKFLKPQISE